MRCLSASSSILAADCHLCDVVHRMARHLQKELSFELQKIDVATDEKLFAALWDRVPVVLIDRQENSPET